MGLNDLTVSYSSSQCRNSWQWLLLKLVNNDTFRWQTNRVESQIDRVLFSTCRRHTGIGTAPVCRACRLLIHAHLKVIPPCRVVDRLHLALLPILSNYTCWQPLIISLDMTILLPSIRT